MNQKSNLINETAVRNRDIRVAFETLRANTKMTYDECVRLLARKYFLSESRIRDIVAGVEN